MAFLDNSGDIILDAVLTDEGRRRLARGDGTFNIVKFALGDDEVNYELYDNNHTSGSAYYDLQILQTPVLEAFTDAGSSLKSSLITYLDTTKLYLPVLRLNEKSAGFKRAAATGSFLVAVTENTRDAFTDKQGVIDGFSPQDSSTTIRIDQGLDTSFDIPADRPIGPDERETTYNVVMDNRLGGITDPMGRPGPDVNFIDDDNIATYVITRGSGAPGADGVVQDNVTTEPQTSTEVIQGPRGTTVRFRLKSTLNLQKSDYLFNNIGSTSTLVTEAGVQHDLLHIDTIVKVVGGTTGYTIDIPIRYIKLASD